MRSFLILSLLFAIALFAGFLSSQYTYSPILFKGIAALFIFSVTFIRVEFGLYILIFSMLLSPEFMAGAAKGSATLGRGVTLRLEDFLLVVIGFSWLTKNAIHKELGLILKTPLNRPIFFYILACVISTGFGIMGGRVNPKTGLLFVLKYIEYFTIFFMMVNHVENMEQIKRFVFCLFLTCFIVSVICTLQIPGGGRVSAPFEGQTGEPNTLGGYLVFISVVASGMLLKVKDKKTRHFLVLLIITAIPPFLFTQSRSSYLACIPAAFIIAFMSEKRLILSSLIILALILSPFLLPSAVKKRISYTFNQPTESGQITVAGIKVDTSTSARLLSWQEALKDWTKRPIFGYGITGYTFMDAQFPRVLIETGIVGLFAFLYLLYSVFKLTLETLKQVNTPYLKGIVIGFLAGFTGLLFHSFGANTFIIVRIMEPFWFFAGIISVLPGLEKARSAEP